MTEWLGVQGEGLALSPCMPEQLGSMRNRLDVQKKLERESMGKRHGDWISGELVEEIFNKPSDALTIYRKGVIGVRTVRVQHGPMLDVVNFPVYARTKENVQKIREIKRESTKAQKLLNKKKSFLRLQYLANSNFEEGDIALAPSAFAVEPKEGEDPDKAARRIATNFVRVLGRYWKKHDRELKYLYTIERTESEKNGRRYHLHLLLNAHGFDRDEIESLWTRSSCNTKRYQENDEFFSGLAGYLNPTKGKEGQEKAGRRYWAGSRNLVEPTITRAYHKFTVAKIEKIARSLEMDARMILESAYPEYRCTRDVVCNRSDFMPGVHMYARMRRKDGKTDRKTPEKE